MFVAGLGAHVHHTTTVIAGWVPRLIGALLVLIIGYFIAKLVMGILSRVLHRAGFDRTLHSGQGGQFIQRVIQSPSNLIGRIAFWAVFLGAVSLAASVLGIAALTAFVGAIWAYLPHVIAALLIFLVAGAIAAGVAALVGRTMGDTPLGKIVATAVPILVMGIAAFMILTELMIATQIVVITYAAIMGAVALGAALAFGLGGREVAGQMLQGAYEKGQENKQQFKQDLDKGIERGKQQVDEKREEVGNGSQATQPLGSSAQ